MNRRFSIPLEVHYANGLVAPVAEFFGWGKTAEEAENDAMERRYLAPDGPYISHIFVARRSGHHSLSVI